MGALKHVHACLVHERTECVVDLVQNLRCIDPGSAILLYNGGEQSDLLHSPGLRDSDVFIHPAPRRMRWGRLHDFALDAMRFALNELDGDMLTIVDSDQLLIRRGYTDLLARAREGRDRLGMLGNAPHPQPRHTLVAPARTAFEELEHWRPWLEQFPNGVSKFVHWTFWPSTVFTAEAAEALVDRFDRDFQLRQLLIRSKLWATEEVLLPTLTALLGFEIARNPARDEFVKFRRVFSMADVDRAMTSPAAYWMHPVPRAHNDPVRARIRQRFHGYAPQAVTPVAPPPEVPVVRLVRPCAILQAMARIPGWLEEIEGDLLLAASIAALSRTDLPGESLAEGCSAPRNLVEIGSYCGRSTSVMACVVKALSPDSKVWAIDPHDGMVGAEDQGLEQGEPTLERFRQHMRSLGVETVVETVQQKSTEVDWSGPIHLLLIDGLHDYQNVSRDFHHFERWLVPGGLILFHDYADYYPGVVAFVDQLLAQGGCRRVELAHTLIAVQKMGQTPIADRTVGPAALSAVPAELDISIGPSDDAPLVSCIMPTTDRRALVPKAIEYFQRQDYPNLELIVLDDGGDSVADLMPDDPRVRYEHLPHRLTMGAKHNLACRKTRGEIVVHWDDDDWMAPWRVSYQVRELLSLSDDETLCGLRTLLFYEPASGRAWHYEYPAGERPWVSGATFCYRKVFWEQHAFPDMNEGADTHFVWSLNGARIVAHDDDRFYVATVHRKNTSSRRLHDARFRPCPFQKVESLLGDDVDFYRQWPL